MSDTSGKKASPPYVSFSSFSSFIKGLSETHVPGRVDKTVMSKYSGSTIYALLPALEWLGLIDDNGAPQPLLHDLAGADEERYKALLGQMVNDKYHFLFGNGLDLSKASSGQVIDAFKTQDISGSTITKCMAFFLALAKAAGINVSSHVKAPIQPRGQAKKKKKSSASESGHVDNSQADDADEDPGGVDAPAGMIKITVPLRDTDDGVIWFPANMTPEQIKRAVKMADFILKNYYALED